MSIAAPAPKENMGEPAPRADARLKVTGAAQYPADFPVSSPAFGYLVTSAIAKGRIERLNLDDARAVEGVLDILTHENTGALHDAKFGEGAATSIQKLGPDILHEGQIIAMVLADSYEAAREAAYKVKAVYAVQEPSATFGSPGLTQEDATKVSQQHKELPNKGDAEAALAGADVAIDAEYSTPAQHHNAMELFSTGKLFRAAVTANDGPLAGRAADELTLKIGKAVAPDGAQEKLEDVFKHAGVNAIEEYAEFVPHGVKPNAIKQLYAGKVSMTGGPDGDKLMYAMGAEFVEVRIHPLTREIRVPRIVGAFAGARIMNTRTARSQYMGGMIWGIGSALHEATEIDRGRARYVNDNLADYLIPVNADIELLEVIMVPEEDHDVNPAGVNGIGELANVGTAAAIANAVYHATGQRSHESPMQIEGEACSESPNGRSDQWTWARGPAVARMEVEAAD